MNLARELRQGARVLCGLALLAFGQLLLAQTEAQLFDNTKLHDLRIQMAATDWQTIKDKYLADDYYPCDIEFDGIVVARVGLRSRGSQSRSPVKPSLGMDFSRYISTQRFAGLKTLVLRNLNQDASMMHEFLAEELFTRVGLPHSRESFARLWVNGAYVGVYLLVEPLDTRYAQVTFGDATGYLYEYNEPDNPYQFEYLGPDPKIYVPAMFDPKTQTASPDAAGLVETIRLINVAPDATFARDVSTVVDLNDFVAHAAAEAAVANWDGLRGVNGMRNLYFYRPQPSLRLLALGWDMDGAFVDPRWPVMPDEAEKNVLVRRALKDPALRKLYFEMLDQAAHAIGDGNWLALEIERIYIQIRQAALDDGYKLCRHSDGIYACSNAEFESGVEALRIFAGERLGFIQNAIAAAYTPDASAPVLRPGSIQELGAVNAGPGFAIVPGSLLNVTAKLNIAGQYRAMSLPLPKQLGGVSLETATAAGGLVNAGPNGMVVAAPAALPSGPQVVRVVDNGGSSNALMVEVRPTASVIFGATSVHGIPVTRDFPAKPGGIVSLYATGTWPGAQVSAPAGLSVTVNNVAAGILWAGWAPNFEGLAQLNIELPAVTGASALASITIWLNGEPGAAYALPVQRVE